MEEFLRLNPQFNGLAPDQLIKQYHLWLEEKAYTQVNKQTAQQVNQKPTKSTDVIINDKTYVIEHWSPTKVYKNIPKVGRYFVVPLSTIVGEIFNSQDGMAPDFSEALPTAILYLFNTMETSDVTDFFSVCLENVYLNGRCVAEDLDAMFEDDVFAILDLVVEVIRINYVVPFSQKGASSSLMKLFAVAKPMMEINNLK